MKKILAILLGVIFVVGSGLFGCATSPVQQIHIAQEEGQQQTFAFPVIGDINFLLLSPRIYESHKALVGYK